MNIKTTLRNTRNSGLLLATATGLLYLTACSSDINYDGNQNDVPEQNIESVDVSVLNDPSLATTYYNSHQIGTRADNFYKGEDWPVCPNLKELGLDFSKMPKLKDYNPYNYNEYYNPGYNFHLPAGETLNLTTGIVGLLGANGGIWPKETPKYYIEGDLTIESTGDKQNGGNLEIYIMPGGKLTCNSNLLETDVIYIYPGGELVQAGKETEIDCAGTIVSNADIDQPNNTWKIGGKMYTYGKFNAKNITLAYKGELNAGCAVTATEKIYITGNGGENMSLGYVSAPTIEIAGNEHYDIILRNGGLLNATNLDLRNAGNATIKANDNEYAMVKASKMLINGLNLKGTFDNVAVKYETPAGYNDGKFTENDVEWNESCQINGDITNYEVVEQPGNECAPYIVKNPNDKEEGGDPVTPPTLENVGEIAPADGHDHPISATCIDVNGDDVYVSWHTQGTGFHGCIEHAIVKDGKVELESYLETSSVNAEYGAIDFNHTIYDEKNGKLFVAGDHPKKGGILGWIDCNGGAFPTGNTAKLNLIQLYLEKMYVKDETTGKDVDKYINGGSGNCIIRNGDYYQTASISGFESFPVSSFNGSVAANTIRSPYKLGSWTFDPTIDERPEIQFNANGNPLRDGTRTGKHIATDGKSVVMLTLINRNNDLNTATASIKVFDASDIEFENEKASYVIDDAVLSPVDGKDVIAIEGNDIWVCLGHGGVKHLKFSGNSISEENEFVLASKTETELKAMGLTKKQADESCANGLAVDKNYVYIAHGGAGLVVLDKNTMERVTNTRYHGGRSANYIAINDKGYIIVAYGLSKVQVYAWKNQNVEN